MKLQPITGPKIAHTAFASWWSLAASSASTAAPHTQCREGYGAHARSGHAPDPPCAPVARQATARQPAVARPALTR